MDFVMKQALGGATKDMGKMLGWRGRGRNPDAHNEGGRRGRSAQTTEEEREKAKRSPRMEAEEGKVRTLFLTVQIAEI
ncbi:hypothetical protein cypCar_00021819 [Cyprinus carpio]|nr:hypothetical protein cypCar_00021819 [Cyprinus carpio]